LHQGCRRGRSSSHWGCGTPLGLGEQAASMGLPGGNSPMNPEGWPLCCASGGPPQPPLWTHSSMTHKLSTSDRFIRSRSGHLRAGSLAATCSLHAVSKGNLSSVFCSAIQTLSSPAEVLTASSNSGQVCHTNKHFIASRASSVYKGKSCMKQRLPLAPSDGTGDGAVVPWSGGTHCSQQRRETSTLQKPLSSSTEKVTPWHYTQGFQVQFNTRI